MLQLNTKNFVYFLNQENENKKSDTEVSNNTFQNILQTMARQVLKEKTPNVQDLDRILQGVIQQSNQNSVEENQKEKETSIEE